MTEYRVTCLAFTPLEATGQMNAMAADGWRFVSTIGPRGGMGVIMAREPHSGMRDLSGAQVWPLPYGPGTAL